MWTMAIGSGIFLAICIALYLTQSVPLWLTLAITFGTIFYHFAMRLAVGSILHPLHRRHINTEHFWFRKKQFETKLYSVLKIQKWKISMPTYNPDDFSLEKHTPSQIVKTMCVSELVHECNVLLSFFPLLVVPVFGEFWVFFLTSLAAACYDLLFVLLQRYNRPRTARLAAKWERRKHS
ncbi:MAG: hypothetical protein IKK51_06980 [Oscillospiraceae bacterium]|nr:hypothetical protein [Oscillospiraceae bacterium]